MALNILDFRLSVLAELPKTKDIFVERLILDGIQDLCRESYCWIENVTGMLSVKDTASYAVTVQTAYAELINVHQAIYDGDIIDGISDRQMDHRDSQWKSRSGTPDAYIYDGDINIRFNVTPDTGSKAISVEAVIMPSSVAGIVPPKIERRHLEAVKNYVKWKVWDSDKLFDPIKSNKYERDYIRRKNALKVEIARDGDEIEVRPRSFITGQTRSPRTVAVD